MQDSRTKQLQHADATQVAGVFDQGLQDQFEPEAPELPPTDGGWHAWTYLAAATALETLVWGFANSYGVFLEYYKFPGQEAVLPVVGTVSTGAMYLLLPCLQLYLSPRPTLRPYCMWLGLGVMTSGLVGAAFAQSGVSLVLTQGVLFGVGGTLLYCPATAYLFEWFSARRGLASGVMFSGTGAGGLVMPLICAALLDRYGQRVTFISIAIGYAALLSALIPFVRPRLPVTRSMAPRLEWSYLTNRAFWLLWLGVLFQGLAAFVPGTYLPSYAATLDLPHSTGTLTVALMNLARVPGQVVLGMVSDRLSARKVIIALSMISALTVFAGWGAAIDAGGVLAFAVVFGAFAGSYTALFPRFIASTISNNDPHTSAILYALFSFARGVGSIVSGPLSSALLKHPLGERGYATDYGALIVFTGLALTASGVGASYKGIKRD